MRATYPSDINYQQWLHIADLIPPPEKVGRQRTIDEREIMNAINYRWSTGCSWRMLPHDFPQWGTVYNYFRRWQRLGVLREMRDVILGRNAQQKKCGYRNHNLEPCQNEAPQQHQTTNPVGCSH